MNKILFAAFLALPLAAGCSLEENPATLLSEKAIFSTEAGLEASVLGCYQSFKKQDLWQGRIAEYLQEGSIIVHWKGNRTTENWQQCLNMTMYSNNQYNQNAFQDAYSGLNVMNNFLDNLVDSPVAESYKKELEAEVRFLRAVMYFYCVRMWGDLPLALHSPENIAEANLPRTSYIKVYKQILDDLTFAEQYMRDKDRQIAVNGEYNSRVCKWAATAFKAVVYNQIGCILSSPNDQPFKTVPDFKECGINSEAEAWTACLTAADNVIDNGPYELEPKFGDLFRWTDPDDWRSKERIMAITSTDLGYTVLTHWTLPRYLEGTQHYSATASNYARIRPERWVLQKWSRTYGGTLATGRADGMTNVYTTCNDPRYACTYIYGSYKNQNSNKTVKVYPSDGCVTGIVAATASSVEKGLPYFRKYLDPTYNATNGHADWYVLRLAEVYLAAAEACAGLSTSVGDTYWNKCFDYIEVVHKRARHSVKSGSDSEQPKWEAGRFATKAELISALYWERVFELHGELHDWFDMRRRGAQWTIDNLCIPMNEFLREPEQGPDFGTEDDGTKGYWNTSYFRHQYPTTVDEMLKRMLCGFPDSEIRVNTAIGPEDQNPYFVK